MIRRLAALTLSLAAFFAATEAGAQQIAPRDVWPNAAASAREGDLETATRRTGDLISIGKTYGIKTYPVYAASAAALASASMKDNRELAEWAAKTASQLDPASSSVAFSEADRAVAQKRWGQGIKLAFQGLTRVFSNHRDSVLSRADLALVGALAIAFTTIVFAIALFIRYARSMSHDFREMLSRRIHGGSVSVLAFALLFLPIFLWLGPMWLAFYWLAIFFGYASIGERVVIVLLLLLVAALPIAVDRAADSVAGIDGPVLKAALSSANQSYQPDALRRLQELVAVVPTQPMLQVLLGNLETFEGMDDQAAVHYRRAIELNPSYAGAHVNLGNLHFLNNEFQTAITEYEKAVQSEPGLAIAYYNASVANSETYKFRQQEQMLAKAREYDPGLVERLTRNQPAQKVVMYHPPIDEAWRVTHELSKTDATRALFGSYSAFDPFQSALNPITIGALVSLLIGVAIWLKRRGTGLANACIKCGRTFCPRCKSARESATYCTQCIHIYLKRDGVSLDTKRQKLEEVSDHQAAVTRRNRLLSTILPGSAQLVEGRLIQGLLGVLLFGLFVTMAILVGRLAPALGPVADVAQLVVRVGAIVLAVIIWIAMALPVYLRRAAA